MTRKLAACGLACTVLLPAAAKPPQPVAYAIDASRSRLELTVYREGAFKAFAHDHSIAAAGISGSAELDPAALERSSVTLEVGSASLRVLDPKSSEKERLEIQDTMQGDKVLDVMRYPEIIFRSTRVSGIHAAAGDSAELTLTGELSLHGVTKTVDVPLRVRWDVHEIQAQGETSLRQTDFGIAPIKIGGGAVKVKDVLDVSFNVVASR